ncbi:hypothetical protein [Pseudomonas sp. NPDC089569]|uniref:hypothetical protein n=1 Tax=Pseudomonas sp. NPDC089569 TaxID=3390722 RepID=UPI003CFF3CAB
MFNSRTVHAVALGSVTDRVSTWFAEASLADAKFDTLVKFDEISDLTLSRFDLEVPAAASEAQITDMVTEATYNLNFNRSALGLVH